MYYTKMSMQNMMIAIHPITRYVRQPLAVLLIGLLATTNSWSLESDRQQPINIDADSSELDARTGFTHIVGNVNIRQGSLEVNSDDAEVYVESGRVTRVLLNGKLATWRQQLDSGEWMDARAAQIDYQVNDATILLTGDAQVDHPQGQITGDKLTYDLETEKLRGDSNSGGRIHIRLEPDVVESNTQEILEDVMADSLPSTPTNSETESSADESDSDGS